MADIEWVHLCIECEQEFNPDDMNQHLDEKPDHHFVECVRNADTTTHPNALTKSVIPPATRAVTDEASTVDENGNVTVILKNVGLIPLAFSERSVSARDFVQIGSNNHTNTGYRMPWDCKIVGISLGWKRILNSKNHIMIHLGDTDNPVYNSPEFEATWEAGGFHKMDLSINVQANQNIRLQSGPDRGRFEAFTAIIWIERV